MAKKKKRGKKEERSPEEIAASFDPRTMEQMMSEVTKLLEGREFESEEEAQAFLNGLLDEGGLPASSPPSTPLGKAQDLVYQAIEAEGEDRERLARKALMTSEDCADAYVLLAEETAATPAEARELYEKGVEAGGIRGGRRTFLGHPRNTPVHAFSSGARPVPVGTR